MATLAEQLEKIVRDHGLDSINISHQRSSVDGKTFSSVSVRSDDGHFDVTTTGTIAEQIASCLGTIAAKRAAAKLDIPTLEAA